MIGIILAIFGTIGMVIVFVELLEAKTKSEIRIVKQGKAAKGEVLSKENRHNYSSDYSYWMYKIKVKPVDEPDYMAYYEDTYILPKNLVVRYFPETYHTIEPEILWLKEEGYYLDDEKRTSYICDINTNFKLNNFTGIPAKAIIQKYTDLKIRVDKGNKIFAELIVKVLPEKQKSFESVMKIVFKPPIWSSIYAEGRTVHIKYNPDDKSVVALDFNYKKKNKRL